MVGFLLLNVANHLLHLAFAVRKCAVAFLPLEMMPHQAVFIDPARAVFFDFFDQLGNGLGRAQANQHMHMIGHTIDLKHFMAVVLHDASDVGKKIGSPGFVQGSIPVFGCKYVVDVNLGVGVRHKNMGIDNVLDKDKKSFKSPNYDLKIQQVECL